MISSRRFIEGVHLGRANLAPLVVILQLLVPASGAQEEPTARIGVRQDSSPASAEAEAEVIALRDLLIYWRSQDKTTPMYDLSARLALFAHRFGVQPEACEAWTELSRTAAHIQEEITADTEQEIRETGSAGYRPGVYWTCVQALLHDLTGNTAEARRLLFEPAADEMIHARSSPMEIGADGQRHHLQRSEYQERHGDIAAALMEMQLALLAGAPAFGEGAGPWDVLIARYGTLLTRNARPDIGAIVLHCVRKNSPESLGARIADQEITRLALVEPAGRARVETYHLRAGVMDRTAILVVGREDELQVLGALVAHDPRGVGHAECEWVDVYGEEAFEAARPALERWRHGRYSYQRELARAVLTHHGAR